MLNAIEYANRFRATTDGMDIDGNALMTALDNDSVTADQDWDAGTTVWIFSDGSKLLIDGNEISAFGEMPNSSTEGWFLVGYSAAQTA